MNDQLANNFTEEVNIKLLNRNLAAQKAALVCMFIYTVLSCIYWVDYYITDIAPNTTSLNWFNQVYPIIVLVINTLSLVGYILMYKSHKLVHTALEERNALSFNKGYHSFYNGSIVTIFTLMISIIVLAIHLFIYS